MTEEELSYLKWVWKKTLEQLYEQLHNTTEEIDREYLLGKIDAYEDILGDL